MKRYRKITNNQQSSLIYDQGAPGGSFHVNMRTLIWTSSERYKITKHEVDTKIEIMGANLYVYAVKINSSTGKKIPGHVLKLRSKPYPGIKPR